MSERKWAAAAAPHEPRDDDAEQLAWDERVREIVQPPFVVGARAMLAAASLRTVFLAENMVPAGAITLIVGEPGSKKSWLAYSLAMAVARAGKGEEATWMGAAVHPRGATGNVLILNYDNPTPECGRRFMRLGMREDDPIFFHSVELDPFRLPKHADELRAVVTHFRPSLIVVDSFRQAQTEDENSAQDMAIVMGHYKSFYANGAAVVIVHHSGKSSLAAGVGKARGSGEIAASADAQISVCPGEPDVAVWDKHRSWELSAVEESRQFALIDRGDRTFLEPLE